MRHIELLLAALITMFLMNSFVFAQDTTLTVTETGIVGIGTTSPLTQLHVEAPSSSSPPPAQRGIRASLGSVNVNLVADVNEGFVGTRSNHNFRLVTNNSVRMQINAADGNVGIGTTSPTAKLHIGGTAGVDGIKFPDGTLQTTAATGGSSLWSASGSDIFYNSGNVGIGTTTPQSTLDIQGTVRATGDVTVGALTKFNGTPTLQASVNDASTNTVVDVLELDRGSTGVVGDGIGAGILFRSEGSNGGFSSIARIAASLEDVGVTTDRGALSFWTFPAGGGSLQERMRINHIGNVGIGTTSPQATLEVHGAALIRETGFTGNAGGAGGGVELRGAHGTFAPGLALDNGSQQWNIVSWSDNSLKFVKSTGTTFTPFTINNNSFQDALVLASNGVGIGTATPNNPLEMASGAHVTAGGVWTDASSRAYKENISSLTQEEAISTLEQLNPVKFNYKVQKDEEYVGFIAEDVPKLVATSDRKSLSPMDIVAVLTKVVQQQQKKIAKLEARLNASQ